MRRCSLIVLLLTALSSPRAFAEPVTAPAEPPRIAVTAVMDEVSQALVWDANRGEYVVVRVGDWVQGFRVRAIFPEQVVIEGKSPGQTFVFALTPRDRLNRALGNPSGTPLDPYGPEGASRPLDPYAAPQAGSSGGAIPSVIAPPRSRESGPIDPYDSAAPSVAPLDPYASSAPTSSAPLDPYASSAPSPGAVTPLDPYPAPPRVVQAPPASRQPDPAAAAPRSAPLDPYAAPSSPADPQNKPLDPYAAPAAPAAPTTSSGEILLRRSELNQAMSDFSTLSKEIQLEAASSGGFRVQAVDPRSLFYRMGLRKDDVVVSVAGILVRSLDDAASVYAAVLAQDAFEARIRRGGKPVTLKFRVSAP